MDREHYVALASYLKEVHKQFEREASSARADGDIDRAQEIRAASPLADVVNLARGCFPKFKEYRYAKLAEVLLRYKDEFPLKISTDVRDGHFDVDGILNECRRAGSGHGIEALLKCLWENDKRDSLQKLLAGIPDPAGSTALFLEGWVEGAATPDVSQNSHDGPNPPVASSKLEEAVSEAHCEELALGWHKQGVPRSGRSLSDTIRYNSGQYSLEGRESELGMLHKFLGDRPVEGPLDAFQWFLIVGQGGEGKTRLAMEFTERIKETWHAGSVSRPDLETFNASRWRPRRDTFIVIDYPAQAPGKVHDLLSAFQRNADAFRYKVRVLLLEREAGGPWVDQALGGESGASAAIRNHRFAPDSANELGWLLSPLLPEQIVAMMSKRFKAEGLTPPSPQLLYFAVCQVDSRIDPLEPDKSLPPRALFAAAVTEVLIGSLREGRNLEEVVRSLDHEGVLHSLIVRDRELRWQYVLSPDGRLDGEKRQALDLHENLVAMATACGGLNRTQLLQASLEMRDFLPGIGPKDIQPVNIDLIAQMVGTTNNALEVNVLEPDILGELFVLETLSRIRAFGEDFFQIFLNNVFALGGRHVEIFALRCYWDFPERVQALGLLAPNSDAGASAAYYFAGLCQDFTYFFNEEWELVDDLFGRLDELRGTYLADPQVALADAKATTNCVNHASKAGEWARVETMLVRLAELREGFGAYPEIALSETAATSLAIKHAGEAGEWHRVDALFVQFDNLRGVFGNSSQFVLHEAMSVEVTTKGAGAAHEWALVDAMIERLDSLLNAVGGNLEIGAQLASALLNIVNHAGMSGDWPRVDAMFVRFDELRKGFVANLEVALIEAMAIALTTKQAGDVDDLGRVDLAFMRFDDLRRSFGASPAIAIHEARSAANAIGAAAASADYSRVDKMFARLDDLRLEFGADPVIAHHEAIAAANAAFAFGEIGDALRMNLMFVRLDKLCERFADSLEIARIKAMAAANASRYISDGTQVDAIFMRIDHLRRTFKADPEIGLYEAMAAANVTKAAAEAGDWERVDALLTRLDNLCAAFGTISLIAWHSAAAAVNITAEARDWAQIDAMFMRIDSLRTIFAADSQIALLETMAVVNTLERATKTDDWGRLDAMSARIERLRDGFPEADEIRALLRDYGNDQTYGFDC